MNVPSLPTDNLYKFLAIGGLVAAALGGFILYEVSEKESGRLDKLRAAFLDEHLRMSDFVEKEIADYDRRLEAALKRKAENVIPEDIKDDVKAISEGRTRLRDKILESQYQRLQGLGKMMESEVERSKTTVMLTSEVSKKLFSIGLTSSLVGFVLWYLKVQRFHDRTMRFEAEKARLETEKTAKELSAPSESGVACSILSC